MVAQFVNMLNIMIVGLVNIITHNKDIVYAFFVGGLGSFAYLTAVYFKFIGGNDNNRKIILEPFYENNNFYSKLSFIKIFWYSFVGGSIALVFQINVPVFAAVQSLIIGFTWPMIVGQFLSGRMSLPTEDEREALIDSISLDPYHNHLLTEKFSKDLKNILLENKEKPKSKKRSMKKISDK